MGIGAKSRDLYRRANESFGRHGIVWAIALFVLPFMSVGALAGYLATTADWYWQHFGLLGVWIAVLLTWVLLGSGLLVVRNLFNPSWLPRTAIAGVSTGMQGGASEPARETATRATWGRKPVNWAPWKLRARYTISELSRILCGMDPNGGSNNETEAFKDTLIEQANAGKLKSNRKMDGYTGRFSPATWKTEIDKAAAIDWAKAHGIDISHLEN